MSYRLEEAITDLIISITKLIDQYRMERQDHWSPSEVKR